MRNLINSRINLLNQLIEHRHCFFVASAAAVPQAVAMQAFSVERTSMTGAEREMQAELWGVINGPVNSIKNVTKPALN